MGDPFATTTEDQDRDDEITKDVVCGCQYFRAVGPLNTNITTFAKNNESFVNNKNASAEVMSKTGEHEYEPVIPMNDRKTSPLVKITVEKSSSSNGADFSEGISQDKNRLRVPEAENEYDNDSDSETESESDQSEQITAEELQQRLEEKYFRCSPATSSGHEYELTETRSVSPATTDDLSSSKPQSPKMQTRADRIRQKLKTFKEQLSKEYTDCSPRLKRKKAKETLPRKPTPPKKNKFNFRKRGPKSQEQTTSSSSSFHIPQAPQWSFPSLSSFSRSRSGSLKERERKRSQSSETDSKRRFDFHFGTYPRFFRKGKKHDQKSDKSSLPPAKTTPKSAPNSPATRRSPFPQRWIGKLKESKKEEGRKQKEVNESSETNEEIIKESIFISLHDDRKESFSQITSTMNSLPEDASKTKTVSTKMEIDDKNFIFISLHEERFPEKLKQETEQQLTEEELEIERELKKAQTVRKFHNMLRKLETDRKLKTKSPTQNDDKPEPVIITEIITDDNENNSGRCSETIEINIETPEDEDVRKVSGEFVPPERFRVLIKEETTDESTNVDAAPSKSVDSQDQSVLKKILGEKLESEESKLNQEESMVDEEKSVPQKTPRKKLRKLGFDQDSKESLSTFVDVAFKDAIIFDEKIIMKTYIKESLEDIPARVECTESEQEFKEYEKALENSKGYTSFEIESSFSNNNTLARLETPVPPERPSRKGILPRMKQRTSATEVNKENISECEPNLNFNTFPMTKPHKPRRRLRKHRTYSNSTSNTENAELNHIQELQDETINKNIINSKQLSVSFLPLMSDDVRETAAEYNLRETSSMIHLTVLEPPRPPKRRKDLNDDRNNFDYLPLPSNRYSSKTSFGLHEPYTNLELNVETEIEYADDVNSTVPDSDSPPKPPGRKRSTKPSLPDDDRTSREIDSLPSELSVKDDDFCDSDSKDANGYATIEKPASLSNIKIAERNSESTSRRKSRRFSDFFTLPRIRGPTNYVSPASQTLNYRRLPRPSRPPRQTRSFRGPTYTNDNTKPSPSNEINFEEEEQLNFNLATEGDIDENEEAKNLQTDDILEKMKTRPLPPPPRPTRKTKDETKKPPSPHYSQCTKKKLETNDLSYPMSVEEKIINTTKMHQTTETISKNVPANECSNLNLSTRFNHHKFDPVKDSYLCEQTHEKGCVTQEYTIECKNPEEFMKRVKNLRAGFFEPKSNDETSQQAKARWGDDKRNIITETRIVERERQISRIPQFEFEKNLNTNAGSSGSSNEDKNPTNFRIVPPVNAGKSNVVNSNSLNQLNMTQQNRSTEGEFHSVSQEHILRVAPTMCEGSLNVQHASGMSEGLSKAYQDDEISTKIHTESIQEPFSRTIIMRDHPITLINAPKDNRTSVNGDQIKEQFSSSSVVNDQSVWGTNAQINECISNTELEQIDKPFSGIFSTSEENCGIGIKKEDQISHENEKSLNILNISNKSSETPPVNVPATIALVQIEQQISRINASNEKSLNAINAAKVNVNELNVRKLSIDEIESSKLTTSNVKSSSMQISHPQNETGNLAINSIEFPVKYSTEFASNEQGPMCEIQHKDVPVSLEDTYKQNVRSRISSMIPEVGSDDESNSPVTKVIRPARRKRMSKTENNTSVTSTSSSNADRATLAELMGQILQICHSSVGQAIHSLLEQFIPEDREKRNEVQAAIWVVTIIVAGCLMLGLQTNEKIVHHHHWDFHFPPPH